jgi:hypothetical protein
MIAPAFFGHPGGLSRDDVLDNVTLYWLTNTGIPSARLYWENKLDFFDIKGVTVPVGVSAFRHELYQAPRSWSEKAYPKELDPICGEMRSGASLSKRLSHAAFRFARGCGSVIVASLS